MSCSNLFDEEAAGGDSSSNKSLDDELDEHISHDDATIVDGGCASIRLNDDVSNTELVEVITDATIEGFPL